MARGNTKVMMLYRKCSGRPSRRKWEACQRRWWKPSDLPGFLVVSYRFTRRLANEPFVVPIQENDEVGQYDLHFLDAYLVDVKTRFEDLNYGLLLDAFGCIPEVDGGLEVVRSHAVGVFPDFGGIASFNYYRTCHVP